MRPRACVRLVRLSVRTYVCARGVVCIARACVVQTTLSLLGISRPCRPACLPIYCAQSRLALCAPQKAVQDEAIANVTAGLASITAVQQDGVAAWAELELALKQNVTAVGRDTASLAADLQELNRSQARRGRRRACVLRVCRLAVQ